LLFFVLQMDTFVNTFKSSALGVATYFTPLLKESKFRESGVITPDEFVEAGDHLVFLCPTWQWMTGDSASVKAYLPKDKQFLVTKNVPCYRRCKDIEYLEGQEKIIEESESDEGWVDTHYYSPEADSEANQPCNMEFKGTEAFKNDMEQREVEEEDDDDNTPAASMDDFFTNGLEEEDPHTLVTVRPKCMNSVEDNIRRTRTYDLSITYDKYYQVPRMWLFGYDENKTLLTVKEMYEDFSQDHLKKTITVETHPHIPSPPMASIHPCRHAEMMKRLIERFEEDGGRLMVHQYMIVFLKFVQSVIPTIEYDFSKKISLS
ncbi:Ubiquitin-like-conjugating enzyme ATG3, partial [Trichinella nativa]